MSREKLGLLSGCCLLSGGLLTYVYCIVNETQSTALIIALLSVADEATNPSSPGCRVTWSSASAPTWPWPARPRPWPPATSRSPSWTPERSCIPSRTATATSIRTPRGKRSTTASPKPSKRLKSDKKWNLHYPGEICVRLMKRFRKSGRSEEEKTADEKWNTILGWNFIGIAQITM